jgi:hypothetical protein
MAFRWLVERPHGGHLPIAVQQAMNARVEPALAAFKQTVAQLSIPIDAFEAEPDA